MRKRLIIPLTLLLVLMQAIPVWAGVNLDINGKQYSPINPPQVEQGTTMVSLDLIGRVLGADITSSGQTSTIKKGSNTLVLTVGNTIATFNGTSINLPAPPKIVKGEVMVPMRFVYEKFGAAIGWRNEDKTITVKYDEKRQGMSVEELLAKSSEVMAKFNTYKVKMDIKALCDIAGSGNLAEIDKMNMSGKMTMAIQQKPVLFDMKMNMSASTPDEKLNEPGFMETEMIISEKGMFMTMPGQESGWVKMDTPGMDIKSIMEQSGGQDPLASIRQMMDFGLIMSYADDQVKNGKSYWVINVTMGPESFNKFMSDTLKKVPLAANDSDDASTAMNELFKNMQVDMVYNVWIDQSNHQMAYMDMDAVIKVKMKMPETEENRAPNSIMMDIRETVNYEVYDLGVPFTVPDVSQAIDMEEFMKKQMQSDEQLESDLL